jgi:heme-degrading monooxygenase HmoA
MESVVTTASDGLRAEPPLRKAEKEHYSEVRPKGFREGHQPSTHEIYNLSVGLLLRRLTMYVVLWLFRPLKERESEFERAYGPSGEWARLFQHGEGYLGTELLQRSDDTREYLVLDRWTSRTAYEVFRARFSSEYRRLDSRLEDLTEEEAPLGSFETLS